MPFFGSIENGEQGKFYKNQCIFKKTWGSSTLQFKPAPEGYPCERQDPSVQNPENVPWYFNLETKNPHEELEKYFEKSSASEKKKFEGNQFRGVVDVQQF